MCKNLGLLLNIDMGFEYKNWAQYIYKLKSQIKQKWTISADITGDIGDITNIRRYEDKIILPSKKDILIYMDQLWDQMGNW